MMMVDIQNRKSYVHEHMAQVWTFYSSWFEIIVIIWKCKYDDVMKKRWIKKNLKRSWWTTVGWISPGKAKDPVL